MAISFVNNNLNPFAASAAGGGGVKVALGALDLTMTTVTLGASGDYSAGGAPLTPAQLGHVNSVLGGWISVRTTAASNTTVGGTLDCTNPAAPKLKLNAIAAEDVGAGIVAQVVDVWSVGD